VCVCVCVCERERERERELTANKIHVSFSQVSDGVKVGCSHQTVWGQ